MIKLAGRYLKEKEEEKKKARGIRRHIDTVKMNGNLYSPRTFKTLGYGQTFYAWAKFDESIIGATSTVTIMHHRNSYLIDKINKKDGKSHYSFTPFIKLGGNRVVQIRKHFDLLVRWEEGVLEDVDSGVLVHCHMKNMVHHNGIFYMVKNYHDLKCGKIFYGWYMRKELAGVIRKPCVENRWGAMESFGSFQKRGPELIHITNVGDNKTFLTKERIEPQQGTMMGNVLVRV